MALDSIQKLRSIPLIPGLPTYSAPPIADGAIDVDDLKHVTGYYRGVSLAGISVPVTGRGNGLLLRVFNG